MNSLNPVAVQNLVRQALAEDLGSGDATTTALIPEDLCLRGALRPRSACVVAGLPVCRAVFNELDRRIRLHVVCDEGQWCEANHDIAIVEGPARAILSAERTALNFLQRLCGIATTTHTFARELQGTRVKLLDTRKTTPCLRFLEKYAVRVGGGENHRIGLFDKILIKDNHREVMRLKGVGGIGEAVARCRQVYPNLEVEVEADTLDEVRAALEAGADWVMLDNMSVELMRQAVAMRHQINSQVLLEASGGMTYERMPAVAETGVDFISVGALTHSARSVDIGLDIEERHQYPDTPA